ncbi:MAG: hypothetical protein WB610_19400 [Rhodomicrobium sp.]
MAVVSEEDTSAAVASAGGISGDLAAAISPLRGSETRKEASVAGNSGCRQPLRAMEDASLERGARRLASVAFPVDLRALTFGAFALAKALTPPASHANSVATG